MAKADPLLDDIERFLVETDMSPTGFGRDVLNDPGFVFGLRAGRECRDKTALTVRAQMALFRDTGKFDRIASDFPIKEKINIEPLLGRINLDTFVPPSARPGTNWPADWKIQQMVEGEPLDLSLDGLLALEPQEVAARCEELDAPTLVADVDAAKRWPASRRELCEFLGIGDSTLAGWAKEQRVPLMAKEAYFLLRSFQLLRDEVRRLRAESAEMKTAVIEDAGKFHLARFRADDTGMFSGSIIARDIPDVETARMFAAAPGMLQIVPEIRNELDAITWSVDPEQVTNAERLDERILRQALAALGTEKWFEIFLGSIGGPLESDFLEFGKRLARTNKPAFRAVLVHLRNLQERKTAPRRDAVTGMALPARATESATAGDVGTEAVPTRVSDVAKVAAAGKGRRRTATGSRRSAASRPSTLEGGE